MIRFTLVGAALALLMGAGLLLSPSGAQADDAGICNYTMQNMFAGPYKVCQNNIDEATCAGRAEEDENSDASFSSGSCASEAAVGTCTTAEHTTTYYEGDPSGLAIGCGFQQGEWADAG